MNMRSSSDLILIQNALDRAYRSLPIGEASGHRWLRHTYTIVLSALWNQMGDVRGMSILDVGAGRGIVSLALSFLGARVTACEKFVFQKDKSGMFFSKDAQTILQAWRSANIRPLIGDVYDLHSLCQDERFDAVVNIEVIEHLQHPKRMLDAIHAVLKDGGILVVSTPNYGRLQARLRLLFGKNPKLDLEDFFMRGADGFIGHWREYLPHELTCMLTWSGFKEIFSSTYCDPWFLWNKRPSFFSAKQIILDLTSYLISDSGRDILSLSVKQNICAE